MTPWPSLPWAAPMSCRRSFAAVSTEMSDSLLWGPPETAQRIRSAKRAKAFAGALWTKASLMMLESLFAWQSFAAGVVFVFEI